MNWQSLWMRFFGCTSLWNIDMGFWVSMGVSLLIALLMNLIFWKMKPYGKQ